MLSRWTLCSVCAREATLQGSRRRVNTTNPFFRLNWAGSGLAATGHRPTQTMPRTAHVLGGPCGAGKTTAGQALANALRVSFVDADDAHTPVAKTAIASVQPLDDAYRDAWLQRVAWTAASSSDRSSVVIACSALAQRHRDALRAELAALGVTCTRFAMLVPPTAVLEARLAGREGHFAGPALLPSQLATLEVGDGEYGLTMFDEEDVSVQTLVAWVEREKRCQHMTIVFFVFLLL